MKRAFVPSLFKNKRARTVNHLAAKPVDREQLTDGDVAGEEELIDLPSDTKAALTYLRSLFDVHQLEGRVPPIVLKHQLYSVIQNKTQVDREVDQLRDKKEIKVFRYGKDVDEFCIVFTDDYISHVRKIASQHGISTLIDRFITVILEKLNNITLSRQTLCDVHGFSDKEITMLVNAGMLTARDIGSWWLSIPGAGIFMKTFSKGRQSVLRAIKKSKYREILQKELEKRKLQAVKKLSMKYHIHDIIGAELVTKVKTTSGILLRVDE